ncbi:MAG: c-type cytochrome, partial [Planctomycetes bacterium]|nr:c-type cytochrome [Planctomycetota bacterium]
QRALFACDWSYGQLYAVHLTPHGAGYTAVAESFASAAPLPLTDIVVRPQDGALYFTVGGRGTDSALYRITYTGQESTAAAPPTADSGTSVRAQRRKLEELHHPGASGAIDTSWPFLSSPDRFLRYAARIAIEHQPVGEWQKRALDEKDRVALVAATVALARCGDKSLAPKLLEGLGRLDFKTLNEEQQLDLVRAYQLIFTRMGNPDEAGREAVLKRLDAYYPAASAPLNRELGAVLIYLRAPQVVDRTLKLLAAAPTQQEQIWQVFALRNVREGWTPEGRQQYYRWFHQAARQKGGHSFSGFVENIRQESVATLTAADKTALKELLNKPVAAQAPQQPPRALVKKWAVDELVAAVEAAPTGRNYAKGQVAFGAANCLSCHRFRGEGGNVGPDLTAVGRRFSPRDLLDSIIEPNKVISDQYQSTVFDLKDGRTVIGRVANMNGDTLNIMTDMLDPGRFTNVRRGEIEETRPSTVSMMPGGLIDTFQLDEILDLLAYLRSGGEPSDPAFQGGKPAASAALPTQENRSR